MPDFTRKLTILSCLLFTSFCFWKAALGLVDVTDASVVSTTEAALSPSYSYKRGITTPIQDMRPGMRIVGRNPNRLETESTIDPTPEGWRLLSVRMLKEDGSYFEAELLRPLSWIHRHRAKLGATIHLNMPELHVVGAAEVLSISECPPIDPGDGPVVVSTFKNIANNVLNIYVEGEETPIGVTAGHPIWSEDRQAFVHSEKLSVGEKLRSALGRTVRITSIEPRAGPEPVYNLEVAGEHVYSVTDAGLLVHNTCPDVSDLYVFDEGSSVARLVSATDINAPRSINSWNEFLRSKKGLIGAGKPIANIQDAARIYNASKGTAVRGLPNLKGKSVAHIERILSKRGFTVTNPGNLRNNRWVHSDGSEVSLHKFGNSNDTPFRGSNNAHVHKSFGRHGLSRSVEFSDDIVPVHRLSSGAHIGIRNPKDFEIMNPGRLHGG